MSKNHSFNKNTLLLNNNYEFLTFISEVRAMKLLLANKAEIISAWNSPIPSVNRKLENPSVLRLKYYIKKFFGPVSFTRTNLFRRDKYICQYCLCQLSPTTATIDHIIPRIRGGKTNYSNTVCACFECNSYKADRTPEEAGLKLKTKPYTPKGFILYKSPNQTWHNDWDQFLNAL